MSKKIIKLISVLLSFFFLFNKILSVPPTAIQDVTLEIAIINELSVSGNPGNLVADLDAVGPDPVVVTDATTTYSFTTNESLKKITGGIDSNPTKGTLKLILTAGGGGGTSTGQQTLSQASSVNLITGISLVAISSQTITYEYSIFKAEGALPLETITVTLTLIS